MSDESKTISVQLDPDFYNRFMKFCFKTELTRSEAVRHGLTMLMETESFLTKYKDLEGKKP